MKIKLVSCRMKPMCCMCGDVPFDMIRIAVRDDGKIRDVFGMCDPCDGKFMHEMGEEASFRSLLQ